MKTRLTNAIALVLLAGFTSCTTLMQTASLLTCTYTLQNVTNPRLAGVGFSTAQDFTRLDAAAALQVTSALLSGSLPFAATVNVGVKNPNTVAAQLAGLDWELFFENASMLSGQTQQAVHVAPNGGSSVIPLTVQLDLVKLFRSDTKDRMLRFANGLMNLGDKNSQVTLKIRPTVSFAGQSYQTGYITLSKSL